LVAAGLLSGVGFLPALSAQSGRDFSGTWILDSSSPSGPEIPRTLTVSQTLATTNVRGEPIPPAFRSISITRTTANGTTADTHTIGVEGGIIGGIVPGPGGPIATSTSTQFSVLWENESLVFERRTYTGSAPETGVWASSREVWSFDADGRLRLVISTRGSADDPRTSVLVYSRP
jgi:hypothetical protein